MFLIDKIDVVASLCEGRYDVLAGRSVSKAVERALEPEGESWQFLRYRAARLLVDSYRNCYGQFSANACFNYCAAHFM